MRSWNIISQSSQTLPLSVQNCPEWEDPKRFGLVKLDMEGRIMEFDEKPMVADSDIVSTGVYVIRRRTLIELLEQSNEEGRYNFVTDVLSPPEGLEKDLWIHAGRLLEQYRICGELLSHQYGLFEKGYPRLLSSIRNRRSTPRHMICRQPNTMQAAKVSNSLIASGCIINSTVEDSVLFKKVFVGNNSVIKNSIIMNGAYIGDNVYIENCIVESSETLLSGSKYVGEGQIRIVSEKKERYEAHQANGEG